MGTSFADHHDHSLAFAWSFLGNRETQRKIRENARKAARTHAGHPAIFGFYVDNEMQPDLVRWYGAARVERFLDSLVALVKKRTPER
ncbi:MAG: hypothetical protein HC904_10045 [Blastochloris sp.]|nr:hypothetical protein [Blastochloris sp.]